MKKTIALLLAVLVMFSFSAAAYAQGLFPTAEELWVELPSFGPAAGKAADQVSGNAQTFQNVTEAQVRAFEDYQDAIGGMLTDSAEEDGVLTQTFLFWGQEYTLTYDAAAKTCVLTYPAGSTVEDAAGRLREETADYAAFKKQYTPGTYVTYGAYEQDNDRTNGKEPIEWLVVAQKGDRALLWSKNLLDWKRYNDVGDDARGNTTWENSTLRAWLNGEFLDAAFNEGEQKQIVSCYIPVGEDVIEDGNGTVDKLFLVTDSDVIDPNLPDVFAPSGLFGDKPSSIKYPVLTNVAFTQCTATEYAIAQGAELYMDNPFGDPIYFYWGMGSDGRLDYVFYGTSDGSFMPGLDVMVGMGIRPMLWLDLSVMYGK